MRKSDHISFRTTREIIETLEFWREKTGIPFTRLVVEGIRLKIKELEEIYKDKFMKRPE